MIEEQITPENGPTSALAIPLLALGAAVGLGLAAVCLFGRWQGDAAKLPGDAAAVINGRVIPSAVYRRALASLREASRRPPGPSERRALLERLVDEELLVQHGLSLGLVELDRKLRGDLVHAVIDHAIAAAAKPDPGAEELERFYESNSALFGQADALLVREVFVGLDAAAKPEHVEAARRRAERARARLAAGEDVATVARELGDSPLVELPQTYLRPSKLRDYLGATAIREVVALEVGGLTAPLRSPDGLHVYQLAGRRPAPPASLASIEELVRREYRRHIDDQTVRALIADLRDAAAIRVIANP